MIAKHEWFTDYIDDANELPAQLAAIEDDGREVFAVLAIPMGPVIISRRLRPTPTPDGGSR